MSDCKGDLYIQIVPLKNSDHKRIAHHKCNPLQRIKVSESTTLRTITNYIKRLASPESDSTTVSLHVNYHNEPLQLPLALSVAEYLTITNQGSEGEVRYSFAETKDGTEAAPPDVHTQQEFAHLAEPRLPFVPEDAQRYPVPSLGRFGPFGTAAVQPGDASFESLLHSGFSLFSNSFGAFPPLFEPGPEMKNGGGEDTISLRKNLEMEILRK
jgi:hypothetical protein